MEAQTDRKSIEEIRTLIMERGSLYPRQFAPYLDQQGPPPAAPTSRRQQALSYALGALGVGAWLTLPGLFGAWLAHHGCSLIAVPVALALMLGSLLTLFFLEHPLRERSTARERVVDAVMVGLVAALVLTLLFTAWFSAVQPHLPPAE